jgi:hypothetical protein
MAWQQEETNMVIMLIKQEPITKRTKIDTRYPKKGRSQDNHENHLWVDGFSKLKGLVG